MSGNEIPISPAVRLLRARAVLFEPVLYDYEERGGTHRASTELGVDEHAIIKTLVFETDARKPLLVLMHGDREVSTKQLARALSTKTVSPVDPAKAQCLTGYMVGGISPFGTRTSLPVYVEESIFDIPHILINGGKRGFLVRIVPGILEELLPVTRISVGIAAP